MPRATHRPPISLARSRRRARGLHVDPARREQVFGQEPAARSPRATSALAATSSRLILGTGSTASSPTSPIWCAPSCRRLSSPRSGRIETNPVGLVSIATFGRYSTGVHGWLSSPRSGLSKPTFHGKTRARPLWTRRTHTGTMPYLYILRCADGSYYVGSTRNLQNRLWQHSTGLGAKYTSTRLPVELVFAQEYERIDEAYEREKQIQGWSRRKREALIAHEVNELPRLSRKHFGP